jgi:hypothetical protein
MTPTVFFESFVEPNCDDFGSHPSDLRLGFNAAVSAAHFSDHYFEFFKEHNPARVAQFKTLEDFLQFISEKTSGASEDVRNVSNAYKHLYTTLKKNRVRADVASTGAVTAVSFDWAGAEVESVEAGYEVTGPGDGEVEEKVVFQRRDGTSGELLPALNATLKFWSDKFRDDYAQFGPEENY